MVLGLHLGGGLRRHEAGHEAVVVAGREGRVGGRHGGVRGRQWVFQLTLQLVLAHLSAVTWLALVLHG